MKNERLYQVWGSVLGLGLLLVVWAQVFGIEGPGGGGLAGLTLVAIWVLNTLGFIVALLVMGQCHNALNASGDRQREAEEAVRKIRAQRRQRPWWDTRTVRLTHDALMLVGLALAGFVFSALFFVCVFLLVTMARTSVTETIKTLDDRLEEKRRAAQHAPDCH